MATGRHREKPTVDERVNIARTHLQRSVEWKGEKQGILEMRSHYANYFRGLPYFKEYRMKFVTSLSLDELFGLFELVKEKYEKMLLFTPLLP
jgi:tRNA-dihydrouridine synthase